ncbi:MAG: hypothetical protein LBR75_02150 [Prevotellaceae bacterium]|jgi:fucose permease|nr:hypothetical protein [Prevotellaceae bacterium]
MSPFLKKISDNIKETPKDIVRGHKIANFLMKYWKMAVLLVLLAMLHINSRYDYENQAAQIKALSAEIENWKIKQNIISSELIAITLEANIVDRIEKRGLGLMSTDTTLIKINKN